MDTYQWAACAVASGVLGLFVALAMGARARGHRALFREPTYDELRQERDALRAGLQGVCRERDELKEGLTEVHRGMASLKVSVADVESKNTFLRGVLDQVLEANKSLMLAMCQQAQRIQAGQETRQ